MYILYLMFKYYRLLYKFLIITIYHHRCFLAYETKLLLGYPVQDISERYITYHILWGVISKG